LALSRSHQSIVFGRRREPHTIIIARGDEIRHFTLRPWIVAVAGSAVAAIAVGYLLATSYLVLRDGLIGATVTRQARMQQAYEDRISALRAEVDRVTSRQLLDQKSVETKVSELLARQKMLTQRHSRLSAVLRRAGKLGGDISASPATPEKAGNPKEASKEHTRLQPGAAKKLALLWNTRKTLEGVDTTERADHLLATINKSLGSIEHDQIARVQNLSNRAWEKGDEIKQTLKEAGLKIADDYGKQDEGGPLIPVDKNAAFESEVDDLDQALDRLDALKAAIHKYPLADPEPGAVVTSGFGVRKDPLLGIPALHPGIDFRSPVGKKVPATAAGTVTHAGWDGGYGRMVEIDHGNGYATRYGHLSEVDVKVGEKVKLGQIIGKSGSTGRSTGPHLHYEIRHNGRPINPVGFLKAGMKISKLL
jgi:murein DD-endopeptidase MepM/ murein hydrolase activator NlpD